MNLRFLLLQLTLLTAFYGCSSSEPAPAKPRSPLAEPTLVLSWNIAHSGPLPGKTGWKIDEGWPAFIDRHVRPAIKWCEESGVKPQILLYHAFGQWDDVMHIDGWDFAKAEGADFLTEEFATERGWKSITGDYDCYAYVGDVQLVDRLRDLPKEDLEPIIRRNLQPYVDAGFKGVYIDCTENAITERYVSPIPHHSSGPSIDAFLLQVVDEMFPERAGIEAAPRVFTPFEPLHDRNVIIRDTTFRHRFGGFTSEQDAKYVAHNDEEKKTRRYGGRHGYATQLGWPSRDHLTGTIWRTLVFADDPQFNKEMARIIASEGDVPVFSPMRMIDANIKASELFESLDPEI